MKRKPSDLPKMSKPKSVKKTIVINCFTGEEREVDRRKIKIVDGMEIRNTRVELDNGVKADGSRRGKIPHSRQSQRTLGRSGRSTDSCRTANTETGAAGMDSVVFFQL